MQDCFRSLGYKNKDGTVSFQRKSRRLATEIKKKADRSITDFFTEYNGDGKDDVRTPSKSLQSK